MRLFQNSSLYPSYSRRLSALSKNARTFDEKIKVFLDDRYGAQHILSPVLEENEWAFFTNGDDFEVQRLWASENGLGPKVSLEDILLAQVEQHRTEVFYNLDPIRYGSGFLRRLPGSVKRTIAWRAAPSPNADFELYDFVVCNFPGILESYRRAGLSAAYFFPAFDPEMQPYADNGARSIDVIFVGGYTRHHYRRAELLEAVVAEVGLSVMLHLDNSRMTQLAESPLGRLFLPRRYRRPTGIRRVAQQPIFGRDLYSALSSAKIVLNCAIDMSGNDRGNLRCFEAMGCGALVLSDRGRYPEGMKDGQTLVTYDDAQDAIKKMRELLVDSELLSRVAGAGHAMVKNNYSKKRQWQRFLEIAA